MDAINSIDDIQKKRMLVDFLCTPAYSYTSHNETATDMELFHRQFVDALNFVNSVKDLPMDEFTKNVNSASKKHIENVLNKKDIVINEAFVGFAEKYHPEYVDTISAKIKTQLKLDNTLTIPDKANALNTDASTRSVQSNSYTTSSNYVSYFAYARLDYTIYWSWDTSNGDITYLAPQTTAWIINDPLYWWDGTGYKVSRQKTDGDYGYVNKLKGFYYQYMSYGGRLVPEGVDINVKLYRGNVSGDRSMKVGYQYYFTPALINWYW